MEPDVGGGAVETHVHIRTVRPHALASLLDVYKHDMSPMRLYRQLWCFDRPGRSA